MSIETSRVGGQFPQSNRPVGRCGRESFQQRVKRHGRNGAFVSGERAKLGAVAGSMTSTPALQQVSSLARSSVPMLGYVGTYAFANVLLAFGGGIIMRL